jgi:TatA/E family protein of Tat protein translocase
MNVSFMELVVIFGLALLLFGPEQLPQIARQVGKVLGDLRKGSAAIRREWYNAVYPPAQEIKREVTRYSSEINTLGREVFAKPDSVDNEKRNVPENGHPKEKES